MCVCVCVLFCLCLFVVGGFLLSVLRVRFYSCWLLFWVGFFWGLNLFGVLSIYKKNFAIKQGESRLITKIYRGYFISAVT